MASRKYWLTFALAVVLMGGLALPPSHALRVLASTHAPKSTPKCKKGQKLVKGKCKKVKKASPTAVPTDTPVPPTATPLPPTATAVPTATIPSVDAVPILDDALVGVWTYDDATGEIQVALQRRLPGVTTSPVAHTQSHLHERVAADHPVTADAPWTDISASYTVEPSTGVFTLTVILPSEAQGKVYGIHFFRSALGLSASTPGKAGDAPPGATWTYLPPTDPTLRDGNLDEWWAHSDTAPLPVGTPLKFTLDLPPGTRPPDALHIFLDGPSSVAGRTNSIVFAVVRQKPESFGVVQIEWLGNDGTKNGITLNKPLDSSCTTSPSTVCLTSTGETHLIVKPPHQPIRINLLDSGGKTEGSMYLNPGTLIPYVFTAVDGNYGLKGLQATGFNTFFISSLLPTSTNVIISQPSGSNCTPVLLPGGSGFDCPRPPDALGIGPFASDPGSHLLFGSAGQGQPLMPVGIISPSPTFFLIQSPVMIQLTDTNWMVVGPCNTPPEGASDTVKATVQNGSLSFYYPSDGATETGPIDTTGTYQITGQHRNGTSIKTGKLGVSGNGSGREHSQAGPCTFDADEFLRFLGGG